MRKQTQQMSEGKRSEAAPTIDLFIWIRSSLIKTNNKEIGGRNKEENQRNL